ncbi:hypothetical protein CRE_10809 [Caenorhabditis remanei]|uniref:Exportin-T n=2 Tax=Caenorhabditis remanei TaxID=31234 RepID=E3M4Z6_CAERE|nr:hypothetical protein CRE_10809 [Caenorhabditis remanei]
MFGYTGIAVTDPTRQAEIYRALESLKKDELGWKKSVESFVGPNKPSAEEQFLLLQVIEDFLNKRYSSATQQDVLVIRNFLLHYIKGFQDNSSTSHEMFLTNKMAHIFSLVFAMDFPERWSTFFNDLFFNNSITDTNISSFYLKVLLAIDTEVVNRDIQRSKNESERNIKIKDAMREICMNEVAKSWLTIANSSKEESIQCLVLRNIAAYVDWIELDLVANDYVMPFIISKLQDSATSEDATSAVCGLMQKGMPAEKKVGLALTVMTVLRNNGLLTVNDNNDEDEVTRVGSLVNTLGLVLLDVQNK